jgi:quercetin 2,3-dioxygenase
MQIWIKPERTGAKPDYADRSFADAKAGGLTLIASKDARQGSMQINQEADVFIAKFDGAAEVGHELRPGRHVWVQMAEGELMLNGQKLSAGDGAAISDEKRIELAAKGPAQALVFDLN